MDIPETERFVFWGLAPDKPRYDGVFMLSALHFELETIRYRLEDTKYLLSRLAAFLCGKDGGHRGRR
jgi:hypothetical protein